MDLELEVAQMKCKLRVYILTKKSERSVYIDVFASEATARAALSLLKDLGASDSEYAVHYVDLYFTTEQLIDSIALVEAV